MTIDWNLLYFYQEFGILSAHQWTKPMAHLVFRARGGSSIDDTAQIIAIHTIKD